jgi:hypothetical protein
MYNREPFPSCKSVDRWCKAVLQDYKKLKASEYLDGKPFMKEVITWIPATHNEEGGSTPNA